MKHLLFATICFLTFSNNAIAQNTDNFDIATFQPPKGWERQNKPGVVIFLTSDDQKGTYAMITLYASGTSTGNAKSDFDGDWAEFIAGQMAVKSKPEIEPDAKADGWDVVTGGTGFKTEMGTAAVLMSTYSGFGKTFSVAAVFNSQDNLPAIEAFASSIKLKKTAAASQPVPVNTGGNASILGTWGASTSGQQKYDDYKNPYAINNYGYIARQYTFNTNGTYLFVSKTFQMMAFDKLLLIKETGTYQISGSNITIIPQKSVIQAWSKKDGGDNWGKLLTTQNRTLEKVVYRFTKHYFSGIDQWNFVLQADRATERDGPFSTNTTFANAWYYSPISGNNPVIELP